MLEIFVILLVAAGMVYLYFLGKRKEERVRQEREELARQLREDDSWKNLR
jgi:preprotein translocase subunit YajC